MSTRVMIPGCFDGAPVEAVVPAEPRVLARHRGADQTRGNVVEPPPALVDAVAVDTVDQDQERRGRRQESIKRDQHDRANQEADNAVERDAAAPAQQPGSGTENTSLPAHYRLTNHLDSAHPCAA